MEIKPSYVTFEQAELLKEKEFDIECSHYYMENNSKKLEVAFNRSKNWDFNFKNEYKIPCKSISAPEQWQVVEWLRVNHGIWIDVTWGTHHNKNVWYYGISKIGIKSPYITKPYYDSPQEAYSAAFDYILNNLI